MTYEQVIEKTTNEFKKWVGYTEKNQLSQLFNRDYNNPGNYNEYAGKNNFTVFAKLYKEKTGIDVQGQPWCDTFVDTIFIHLYGVDMAKKLLGGFSAYTPDSAKLFKNMNRYSKTAQKASIIFFKNNIRIYHTGFVYGKDNSRVYTYEGNTSSTANTVVENGGCVAAKYYNLSHSKIDGYGMPDYNLLVSKDFYEGWLKAADNKRWWYQFKDGTYAKNDGKNDGWYRIDDFWYLFDKNGYMLTGKQVIGNCVYFLNDEPGSDEGKLMATYGNKSGILKPWNLLLHPSDLM